MHGTVFSSIPGLYPLDPSSTSQVMTIKTSPKIATFPQGEDSAKSLTTTALNRLLLPRTRRCFSEEEKVLLQNPYKVPDPVPSAFTCHYC